MITSLAMPLLELQQLSRSTSLPARCSCYISARQAVSFHATSKMLHAASMCVHFVSHNSAFMHLYRTFSCLILSIRSLCCYHAVHAGIFIADALSMPVHWYYSVTDLKRDFGEITDYQVSVMVINKATMQTPPQQKQG